MINLDLDHTQQFVSLFENYAEDQTKENLSLVILDILLSINEEDSYYLIG